jgi:4-hydroxy-tetrahydrodipicolinate synthase
MAFGRLLTAMVTPFHPDESVNLEAAAQLARFLVDTGSDGIVVTGTTGESPTLTTEEKLSLYRTVKEAVGDRAAVIAGTGNYCTRESIELTREAETVGVDGAMLVVPYYNNPPQEGLYRHFRAIAESTALPVILYNVPSRSPRNMEASTVIRLAEISNIVASFQVYSGDDSYTLPLMSMGGYGIISVAGHLAGKQIKAMIEAFVAGRVAEAAELHGRLVPLFNACFCTTNPIPVKAGVNLLGIPAGGVRLPMIPADEKTVATVSGAMQELGLL